ncbi:MAG: Fe-S cluster assembly protein SufD [Bacteroidetes bacterium CG2_30_33_31]|nr:MAG: Fe-S cluster assembly protein SufD [Bacteroidetes bacterium CG2_30_33_31]
MKKIETKLYDDFLELFRINPKAFSHGNSNFVKQQRELSRQNFEANGFPSNKNENWRKTDLSKALNNNYIIDYQEIERGKETKSLFECEIIDFDTKLFTILNGWWASNTDLTSNSQGVIISSMRKAQLDFPEIFDKYYGKVAKEENGLISLNCAFYTDGYFIYIPDNVEFTQTIQIVNLIESQSKLFSNTRNLVVMGRNSKLKLVHCDDSLSRVDSVVNSVTEIIVGDGANLDFYKLQNKDEHSTVLTSNFIEQGANSQTNSNTITLNGGLIRNHIDVKLAGKGGNANVFGLYLVDKTQFVDNHIFVDHAMPNCTSRQLFKGIADDNAKAVFSGHILVRQDAQKTEAYQNNNNIQLTDTAGIFTHPFLEIFADDVKCSHGATVGQLDNDALFYMMQRGICERTAKMLLMFSFTQQVIEHIQLSKLRERIVHLVTRRLKGELASCENCALSCENPNSVMTFEIDMEKV